MIVDELLTDFLGVTLRFDPLPLQVYAQTEWKDSRPVVTVNSLTEQIAWGERCCGGAERLQVS